MSPGSVAGRLLSGCQFSSLLAVTIFLFGELRSDSQTGNNYSWHWFSNHRSHQMLEGKYRIEKRELSNQPVEMFLSGSVTAVKHVM